MQNSFKQPTIVAHPETGAIITPSSNNPEFGTLRLDQIVTAFTGRFMNSSKRTVFMGGRIEDFKALNLKAGQTFPGKIIKHESFNPFYEGQTPKINPTTQEVIEVQGKPVFMQFEYSEDPNALDIPATLVVNQEATQPTEKAGVPQGNPGDVF